MSIKNLKLYPYKMGSESAKELANNLEVLRVKPNGRYVPKRGQTVVNWGSSTVPSWMQLARTRGVTVLNRPESVRIGSNKRLAFEQMYNSGVRVPDFTTDRSLAQRWLDGGDTIIERHSLSASSGEGIRIVNPNDSEVESNLTNAPLYVKYLSKTREFRVHVFKGEVIDYAEKKKRKERGDNFDNYVCSNERGWVFCRNNIAHLDSVKNEAIKAVDSLGLDFAAVDVVLYNEKAYVLEANTAPGLMGTTLKKYSNRFRKLMGLPTVEDVVEESSSASDIPESVTESSDTVTFTLDKTTAIKLKALLSSMDL